MLNLELNLDISESRKHNFKVDFKVNTQNTFHRIFNMRIGDLAKISGVAASTIRFYESKGLLPKIQRSAGGFRTYDEAAQGRLQLIRFAQSLGFSLDELPELLDNEQGWDHQALIHQLRSKQQEADALLQQVEKKRRQITDIIFHLEDIWSKGGCMTSAQLSDLLANAEL